MTVMSHAYPAHLFWRREPVLSGTKLTHSSSLQPKPSLLGFLLAQSTAGAVNDISTHRPTENLLLTQSSFCEKLEDSKQHIVHLSDTLLPSQKACIVLHHGLLRPDQTFTRAQVHQV